MTTTEPSSTTTASDARKVAAIRDELPAVTAAAYLNAGTNGPLPRRAYAAIIEQTRRELEQGRIGPDALARLGRLRDEAATAMAGVLGCVPGAIAITHNTTEGMNIALMGMDWHPGDEIVTSRLEHPGGLYPVYLAHQRYGARIRMTDIGLGERDPLAELRAALSPRTRAVVLSHVSWATGMVLPLRALADLAHQAGALLIADAAQACGMVPSRVVELGVDAYACSGQKWLCGPDGTGALFIREDRLGEIQPSFLGYHGVRRGMSDDHGHFVPAEGAQRFEVATLSPAGLAGMTASLGWLAHDIGWDWIYARSAALGRQCAGALGAIPGVAVLTPADHMAGLVHFTVGDVAPGDVVARLREQGILIRATARPEACRVSLGYYNTEGEIARLAESVRAMRTAA